MSRRRSLFVLPVLLVLLTGAPLLAQGGTFNVKLLGFEEVPSVGTSGSGRFKATINEDGSAVDWELTYENMDGDVTQAHVHFSQRATNGGIVVFLCSNLGNGPAGTQACPTDNGSLTGTFTAADMTAGANAQGIQPGEFFNLLRSMRTGNTYANVHSTLFPGGEIRGQLIFKADR
jgi:hypothetical protein